MKESSEDEGQPASIVHRERECRVRVLNEKLDALPVFIFSLTFMY